MNKEQQLAPYAASSSLSQGRRYAEIPSDNEFQRDCERITSSQAFRCLQYKTQLFGTFEEDIFRNRLTHTLEVTQITRSIARKLQLNEDLSEAISLAHDLGHTPFAHAGQDALNQCLQDLGGFDHNIQALRVVDKLEIKYGAFNGLNLTFEVREGIVKDRLSKNSRIFLYGYDKGKKGTEGCSPSLEAQLVNMVDEIVYTAHDIDDGFRSGLLRIQQLSESQVLHEIWYDVIAIFPGLDISRTASEIVNKLLLILMRDITITSSIKIAETAPKNIDDVRNSETMIGLSEEGLRKLSHLKSYIHEKLHCHHRVQHKDCQARMIIKELFSLLIKEPTLLPTGYRQSKHIARNVADYVASLTERQAYQIHKKTKPLMDLLKP